MSAVLEDAKAGMSALLGDMSSLKDGIKDLDNSVAEATEQHKSGSEEFIEFMTSDTAAKELLQLAKNRLNNFCRLKHSRPSPKRELSAQE